MSLGTDPEFFIFDKKQNPVPSWKYFPPKSDAIVVPSYGKFFRDGYALEINTPPSYCRTVMAYAVWELLRKARQGLPEGYSLSTVPAVRIKRTDVLSAPMDCQVFGCDPSWSAYSDEPVRPDLDPFAHEYRYAGGHMHLSMPSEVSEEDRRFFVKLCDLFIGLPLAYIYNDEANRQRRQYYGRAGEFRFQDYGTVQGHHYTGIEYRVPPPQLWNNQRISNLFFGVFRSLLGSLSDIKKVWKPSWEPDLQKQINDCDVSEKWLQSVVGFYTPSFLRRVKAAHELHQFTLADPYADHPMESTGIVEWAIEKYPKHYGRLLGLPRGYSKIKARYGEYIPKADIRARLLKVA